MTQKIIKFNGEQALKHNCRKIKGDYYEKNVDCFLIDGKWYRLNSGYIEYDHEINEYVIKSENLKKGIVGFENGKRKEGFFSPNIYNNVYSQKENKGSSSLVLDLIKDYKSIIDYSGSGTMTNHLLKAIREMLRIISLHKINQTPYAYAVVMKNIMTRDPAMSKYCIQSLDSNPVTVNNFSELELFLLLETNRTSLHYALLSKCADFIVEKESFLQFFAENFSTFFDDNSDADDCFQEFSDSDYPGDILAEWLSSTIELNPSEILKLIEFIIIKDKSLSIDLNLDYFSFSVKIVDLFDIFDRKNIIADSIIKNEVSRKQDYLLIELLSDLFVIVGEKLSKNVVFKKTAHTDKYNEIYINNKVDSCLERININRFLSTHIIYNYHLYKENLAQFYDFISNFNLFHLFESIKIIDNIYSNYHIHTSRINYLLLESPNTSPSELFLKKLKKFLEARTLRVELPSFLDSGLPRLRVDENRERIVITPEMTEVIRRGSVNVFEAKVAEELLFINLKVANQCGYYEVPGSDFVSKTKETKIKNGNYSKLNYNVAEDSSQESEIEKDIKKYYSNYNILTNENLDKVSKLLDNKTFGIEYETSKGYIPKRYLYKTGLVPLRDGSLDGGIEYTSLPMSGSKGLQNVINQCKTLRKYCLIDDKCSLHVHIGNVPRTKEFGIALYMLFSRIQSELFEIIPPYKRDLEWISRRGKDYCKTLRTLRINSKSLVDKDDNLISKEVDKAFSTLFLFLTENHPETDKFNFSSGVHPKHGQGKWNYKSRYYALNLINLYFSKYKTVEFRMHTPTMSFDKTLNWLLICNAIVRYAELNYVKIFKGQEKIDLTEIIYGYYDNFGKNDFDKETAKNVADHLLSYIDNKKEEFNYYFVRQKVIESCGVEISNDYSYRFVSDSIDWTMYDFYYKENKCQIEIE